MPNLERVTTAESDVVHGGHNPLSYLSQEQLFDDVARFAQDKGLRRELPLLQKGALVAQGEVPVEEIDDITAAELEALGKEKTKPWTQPRTLYFTIVVCSLGATVQGWSQTGSNGANLSFPAAFGIGSDSPRDALLVGLINSGPYICVALLGAWTSAPINALLGRRGAITVGSSFLLVSSVLSAFTENWPQLLICRLGLGMGMGINSATVSIYAAECAPASIRGGLAVSWQMFTAFGIFLGFCANLALAMGPYGTWIWRLQLGSAFIPTLPLLACVWLCPESPSWLAKSDNYPTALNSFSRLRNTELQAARDLYYMYAQQRYKDKLEHTEGPRGSRLTELFTISRNRRATVAAITVMFTQQACGINIIAFYSSTIFLDAGFSTTLALVASCVFGFVNFLFAWPAVWTMDSLGRRSLLLLALPQMAWTMLAVGLCFLIPEEYSSHLILLAFFIFLFTALYSPSVGPVPFTYAAEAFPSSHREIGMSLAVSSSSTFGSVLSLTFPWVLASLKPVGAFGLYAGLNIVAFILIFLFLPETKEMTLEELDRVFETPTPTYIKYQVTEIVPWFFKRYVLMQKNAEIRPFTVVAYQEIRGRD